MSVVVEFTISTRQFAFGSALTTSEEMRISLERIVPTSDSLMPFIWAEGEGFESFERRVLADPQVRTFSPLDRVGDRVLYRIEWDDVGGIIEAIEAQEAVVLEARGDPAQWYFRVRFTDHEGVSAFYDFCTANESRLDIEQVYTPSESGDRSDGTDRCELTPEQLEAITIALDRGYFATPRGATLGELADDLGISQQALSDRVRRATEKVVRRALLRSAPAIESVV